MNKYGTIVILIVISFLGFCYFSPALNSENFYPQNLTPRSFLMVFAHADDEVTNAGFISRMTWLAPQSTIITLTDGRANEKSQWEACAEDDMFSCRTRELRASAANLGIKEVLTPGFADSKLSESMEAASDFVAQQIRAQKPDVVLTMEPSGLNHHADHMAAYTITMKALAKSSFLTPTVVLSTLPFPIDLVLKSDMPSRYLKQTFSLSNNEVDRKIVSARAHASQTSTIEEISFGLGPRILFSWINKESYFVLRGTELKDYLQAMK